MTKTIGLKILPFFLITLLVGGGVEGFYRYADNYLSTHKTVLFPKVKKVAERKKSPPQNTGKALKKNYDIIVARALFKSPVTKTVEKPVVVETEAETSISSIEFALIGTITGKDDGSRAILLDKKKKTQEIFYLGDGFDSVIVKEISRGKVVLDVNGKNEILLMEENKTAKSPANKMPGLVAPPPSRQVRTQPKVNKKLVSPGGRMPPKRRTLPPEQR